MGLMDFNFKGIETLKAKIDKMTIFDLSKEEESMLFLVETPGSPKIFTS